MPPISIGNYASQLIEGLRKRNIDFVLSEDVLGCDITEIYITEANQLLIFPTKNFDTITIQWLLRVRTPLKVRITIFSSYVSKIKLLLLNAIDTLKQEGLTIPNFDQAVSVQDLTGKNIQHFLDSLENWAVLKSNGRPLPKKRTSFPPSTSKIKENHSSLAQKLEDLHVHLRNAIKTYWTERYFARYLNIPPKEIQELASRIGIQREVCGTDTLYFFDRKKGLGTYFEHIVKAILNELNLKYQETSQYGFFLPNLHLTLHFFDGEKEQPKILASEGVQNRDLIVIAPEALTRNIRRFRNNFFRVLPLNQEKIKGALIRIIRKRIDYIPAYSSGLIN
ncbi:MAG: hypothetical protein ACFFCF_12430 [Promethearchaeota archaeon]